MWFKSFLLNLYKIHLYVDLIITICYFQASTQMKISHIVRVILKS